MKTPIRHRIYLWVSAWLNLYDGVIGVATLGFYNPNLTMRYLFWYTKGILRDKIDTGV